MGDKTVLITTSGIGSRLGNLTKFRNKSLVRIGEKPAISHIIEYYPPDTNFIITLGYFGDYVKQFISLSYPDLKVQFIEVDKFSGPGSSLGYSISKCKDFIKGPFIYHASDTIIKNPLPIDKINTNWIICGKTEDSSHYRTIIQKGNNLVKFNEKGEIKFDAAYIGICGIADWEFFFETLDSLLLENDNFDLSDTHVINSMLSKSNFECFYTKNWFDIGNTGELKKTRSFFPGGHDILDKEEEDIYFIDNNVIKFFNDKKVNKNRIERSKILGKITPDIIGETDNFYKYPLVKGEVLSKTITIRKFRSFLDWSRENLWIDLGSDSNFRDRCLNFYKDKTIERISRFLSGEKDTDEIINGIMVPSIDQILNMIDFESWLSDGIPRSFHGDFILENVIDTGEDFKLIDWRQDFQGEIRIGDLYYDLAKLNHNLIFNHDLVNRGNYKNLEIDGKRECEILISSKMIECREYLHRFIESSGWDLKKVKILTPLIWLNMSPLHEYPLNKFLFSFGKYNLYKELYEL
jgi:NDP-sugar pyrophosphorylase family protein